MNHLLIIINYFIFITQLCQFKTKRTILSTMAKDILFQLSIILDRENSSYIKLKLEILPLPIRKNFTLDINRLRPFMKN
jgi:hypothetical protein